MNESKIYVADIALSGRLKVFAPISRAEMIITATTVNSKALLFFKEFSLIFKFSYIEIFKS